MVNFFIYAKDFSLSTKNEEHYHTNGLKTLEQFKSDVENLKKELANAEKSHTEWKIIYLHWGHSCEEVDEETTIRTYLTKLGEHGDTRPETIIHWLQKNYDICCKNNKIKLLYIITDGMTNTRSTEKCFELNENMHYETVVFHAFNKDLTSIDLSVASSFFMSRCITYRNYELYDDVDISDEYKYDKINIDNFESEKDNLKSYIKLKYLRKSIHDVSALKEVENLKKLRSRLFDELLSQTHGEHEVNLETKDKSEFIREFVSTNWYKNLVTPNQEMKVDAEKAIATLINYIVSESKSYSFDALKFDTKFNKSVDEEPIVDVNFPAEQEIAFPDIIMEDEKGVPVIILAKLNLLDKIIFHHRDSNIPASFSKLKSTMECPLFLVKDKDISESIGYFYTFNVYKQFMAHNTRTEPRTRKPFHGGVILTDTEQFDKYNDYILSATYFDSKKVNFNIGLFYYVLWKNCENKEWMDRNVVDRFKNYAMRRISETICKIGLSSLPLDPQINTSLPTALWYCVELSSHIFKDDPQNYTHERLRMFHGVAHCMIEILNYFEYDLNLKFIERRRELMSYVMILKKIQTRREKVYYLLENIFKTVNGFLISDIEKPFNLYKLNYLKLNHKDLLRDDVIEETVHLNDYVHLMHIVSDLKTSIADKNTFEICETTFRPFFAIDQSKSFYTELVNNTRKVMIINDDDKDKIKMAFEAADSLEFARILSLYNLFIHCVIDLEKYPTLSEYVEYISRKKKFYDSLVTIFPSNVYIDIKNVYNRYQTIVTKVDVNKFIQTCQTTANRIQRIKVEDRVKFNSEDDIKEFILNEELKVNLKRSY